MSNKKNNKNLKLIYFLENYGQYKAGQGYEKSKVKGVPGYFLSKNTTENEEKMKKYLLEKEDNIEISNDTDKVVSVESDEDITEKLSDSLQINETNEFPQPQIPEVNVIDVPDEEAKQQLMTDAIIKGKKFIDDANEFFELTKVEAQEMISKIKDTIEERVLEATKIRNEELDAKSYSLDEREKGITDFEETIKKKALEDAQNVYKDRLGALESKSKDLEGKLIDYLNDLAALDVEKKTFRSYLEEKFNNEYKELFGQKTSLENKIAQLNQNIKKIEADNRNLKDDNNYLEGELVNLREIKSKLTQLEFDIKEWEGKYKKLEDSYVKKLNEINSLKVELLEFGNDPSKAIKEKEALEAENERLSNLLVDMPSEDELNDLRTIKTNYNQLKADYSKVAAEKSDLFNKKVKYDAMATDLENYKRYIRILENQKFELENELKRNAELYNNRALKVFANLSEIDNNNKKTIYPANPNITLKDLCIRFRGYLAFRNDKQKLYYDEDVIRTFIAGFASARLSILEGLSGTGKSSLPRAFMDFIGAHTIEVPVQSSWKDRNDLLGFYNDFKKQYKETDFLKALYKATSDPNGVYLIVLDEMNLSRIEYYFADFLSVLQKDRDDWEIELISDYASINTDINAWPQNIKEGKIRVLDNTWFIGTANKDDSTFMITDKVYDRSVVIEFQKKGQVGKATAEYKYYDPVLLNNEDFQRLMRTATRISTNNQEGYKKLISDLDSQIRDLFDITFGNRIENQLDVFVPCYINCGGTYEEAVDIMFSKKVLRKLEAKYDEKTKDGLILFVEYLDDQKLSASLPRTRNTLKKMIEKI